MEYEELKNWFEAVKKANPNYKKLDEFDDMFDLKRVTNQELIDKFPQFLIQELMSDVYERQVKIPENLDKASKVALAFGVGGKFIASMATAREEAYNARIAREKEEKKTDRIEERIQEIYKNKQMKLMQQKQQIHKTFIEHAASKLPTAGQLIELTQEVLTPAKPPEPYTRAYLQRQHFINFIDQYGTRYDPKKEIIRPNLHYLSVKNIINFSISLADKNEEYKRELEGFQKKNTADLETQSIVETLKEIKALIETDNWPVGERGSRTKIYVNGNPKEIPNNLHKIYKTIGGTNFKTIDHKGALKVLKDVQEIANKAKTDKPFFFADSRRRDEKVQKAYESIDEETNKFLKK